MTDKCPWWGTMNQNDFKRALAVPCPHCGAEKGVWCSRGLPHIRRLVRVITVGEREDAQKEADRVNGLTPAQRQGELRQVFDRRMHRLRGDS